MKFSKVFAVIAGLTVIFCLTACKKDVEIEKNNNSNTNSNIVENISGDELNSSEIEESGDSEEELFDFQNQFQEEIKEYAGYMTNIKMFLESTNEDAHVEYGVSSLLEHLKNSNDPFASLSYTLKDLNKDGIEEIMLFDDTATDELENAIISMCTMSGDTCYNILNSQKNMIYKLYKNNVIKMELSDIEYVSFIELDKNMNFITLDSIESTTPSGDAEAILNKYKEADLELKKVK